MATWSDGVFVLGDGDPGHELAGRSVRSLAPDGAGGALAIVDDRSLRRRSPDGTWRVLASGERLACCIAAGNTIYVGTDEARMLRLVPGGELEALPGFDSVPGRETWYAGQALVDGRLLGPPLGVRSLAVTADGATLLANVHVGGIPRSTDGGLTWHPTIAVDADVHEVRAHPRRANVVIAASAAGLCSSADGGATWSVSAEGLHASYCSAVGFAGEDVLVSAAEGHFATRGAIYRRPLDGSGPLASLEIGGIADTTCIASDGATVAVADRAGQVHVSSDAGRSWARRADGLPAASSVLALRGRAPAGSPSP